MLAVSNYTSLNTVKWLPLLNLVLSSAQETMTDRRNRIHEGLMEMLQMLKFSLKSGRQLDFSSREDVIAYLESVLEAETTIPEDIMHLFSRYYQLYSRPIKLNSDLHIRL